MECCATLYSNDTPDSNYATLYSSGMSIAAIARQYKVSSRTIQRRLSRSGYWKPGKLPTVKRKSKYSYDENFFDEIDSELKAYWLGFIAADGNVMIDSRNRHYVRFHLAIKDKEFLSLMSQDLKADYPIKVNKKSCRLVFCGRHMAETLISHGITPNKTHTLQWPDIVSKELERHFCRGYVDGDGCWHVDRKGSPLINITGNPCFIEVVQQRLMASCNLNKTRLQSVGTRSASLVYGGRFQCRRIYDWLYSDAIRFMERKRSIVSSSFALPE